MVMADPIGVIGYVRVSTAEQADSGAGLEAQRASIQQAAEGRGWRLLDVFEDAGVSGKGIKRPGLEAALRLLDAGSADALVVAKIDRLSRSLGDFTQLMERSVRKGWALVALDVGVDTTTPNGELMVNVMATFAQFERRIIGQRTKEALAVKRQQGVRLGRPPILSNRLVRRIVAMRNGGASFAEIADHLNRKQVPTAHGGKQWYPATVRKVTIRAEGFS